MRTQREGGSLQTKERGLRRTSPTSTVISDRTASEDAGEGGCLQTEERGLRRTSPTSTVIR